MFSNASNGVMDKLPPVRTHHKPNLRCSSKEHIFLTPDFLTELTEDNVFGINHVNIKFNQRKQKRTGGCLPKIIRKKVYVDDIFTVRTMDSGSEGFDFPDDAIDKVAKANSVRLETNTILPQVRASPCPLHTKHEKKSDSLYASANNPTSVLTIPTGQMKRTSSHPTLGKEVMIGKETDKPMDTKSSGKKSSLPGNHMPSKEFVLTWLMYGSEPGDKNHFPELVKTNKSKHKPKRELAKDITFGE